MSPLSSPLLHRARHFWSGLRAKRAYLLISLAVVVLDQWSKWLVELHLPLHASHPVVAGFFHLTHVQNTGVAFGLFASGDPRGTWLLSGLGTLALILVLGYFAAVPRENRLLLGALALVLGGAVGNLADRLAAGAVTDFLDVFVGTHHWPAFNVADSAITVGIVLLAIDAFRLERRGAKGEAAAAP
jgi:signal peptidase II